MRSALIALGLTLGVALVCATGTARAETLNNTVTSRISVGTFDGASSIANAPSTNARTSPNGRFVVFESTATNLVTPDVSGVKTVYLYDRQAGTVELIARNLSSSNVAVHAWSPSVSADGRYVVFASDAADGELVEHSCIDVACHVHYWNNGEHIYVRDRLANETMLLSMVELPCKIYSVDTATNKFKVTSDPEHTGKMMPVLEEVRRRIAATIVGVGNSHSDRPSVSADGRFVVYDTDADNLAGLQILPGDVVKYDKPIAGAGQDYDDITGYPYDTVSNPGNPRYNMQPEDVLFQPKTSNRWWDQNGVRDVYLRDGEENANYRMSMGCKYHSPTGCQVSATIDAINGGVSDDGTYVTFQTPTRFIDLDTNSASDIFLVERSELNGEVANLRRVSNNTSRILAANGSSINASLSADGRFVAYESDATNLVVGSANQGKKNVFVYDTKFYKNVQCGYFDKPTKSVLSADADVTNPRLAGSGNYVAMQSSTIKWGADTSKINIYTGSLSRSVEDNSLVSCYVDLSSAAGGTGGDNHSTLPGVGVVPRTVGDIRTFIPSVVYQSLATNVGNSSDGNAVSDIFQAPICSTADAVSDTDGDGTTDCFDQCWKNQSKVVDSDSDGDGVPDCEDGCPSDAGKMEVGVCGCGAPETDSDFIPRGSDGKQISDEMPDCKDLCDEDAYKIEPGVCGCGNTEDSNNNGISDCKEAQATPTLAPTPTPTPSSEVESFTPVKPTVKRLSNNLYEVTLHDSGGGFAENYYKVQLLRIRSGLATVINSYNKTSLKFRLTVSTRGTYRVRYSIKASSGKMSKRSVMSASFVVR